MTNKRIRVYSDNEFSLPDDAVVVSLSIFPADGEWGGAIRSREISKAIKSVFPNSYTLHCHEQDVRWIDIPDFLKENHPQLDDIRMLHKDFYSELYIEGTPDAIIFDHPWLWTEAKKLKKRYPEVKIIHSSHNIEFKLKAELLNGLSEDHINEVVRYVEDIEIEIAESSDLIICVTEKDADWFRATGAKNVIAVNNGTNAYFSQPVSNKQYALVVGSGHPPNVEGSIKYLSDAIEWLPDNTDIIFVGTMCDSLVHFFRKQRNNEKNTNIILLGKRTDKELNTLIGSASVIVLPIPYGGGSNLKTAEAIISGRPIVGTDISFRGFEEFISSPNVKTTDDIEEFRNYIKFYCEEKLPSINRDGTEKISWDGTTKPLVNYLRSVCGTSD